MKKWFPIVLIIIAVIVQIAGMLNPLGGDAGRYAAISKAIITSGDWLNIQIHGEPYIQKPPLLMWLSAIGFKLFGISNFTSRLFPLLYSLLMLVAINRFAKLYYSNKIAGLATFMTGTSVIFFLYNNDLHTDVILTTNVMLAVWQLAVFIERRHWINLILGFVAIGLSILSKGPIGFIIPTVGIGLHLLVKKEFKLIFDYRWLIGILISAAVITPYLLSLNTNVGADGLRFFFWTNIAGRVSGSYQGSGGSPLFYFYNILFLFAPWGFFALIGLVRQVMRYKNNSEFIGIGITLFLLAILSVSKMKSPNYIYPAIPFLAIMAANYMSELNIRKWHKTTQLVTTIICIALAVISITYLFPTHEFLKFAIVGVFSLLAFVSFFVLKDELHKLIYPSAIAIILVMLMLNIHVLPNIFKYQSTLPAAKLYNQLAKADEPFYSWRYGQFEQFFYFKNDGTKLFDENIYTDPNFPKFEELPNNENAWFWGTDWSYILIRKSGRKIIQAYEFEHIYITDINWKFLNPKTRKQATTKMVLLQTGSVEPIE